MRRPHIDWLRGLAVVVMLLAHTMDSWTRDADRGTLLFSWQVRVAGMGAPLFLFLAGVGVALSGSARVRRGLPVRDAARGVQRRGWEIFGLAFLFRIQSWVLSPGSTLRGILKVDILNVMGPAMAGAAVLWGVTSRTWSRVVLLACAASACSLLTPVIRSASWPDALPAVLAAYLRPPPGRAWFTLFPWAGLLFAGTALGTVIDRARTPEDERRMQRWIALAGASMLAVSIAGSYLPSVYRHTDFWTTSPSYFFARVGLMTLLFPAAFAWSRRPGAHRWSPMLLLGRTSLFIYWVHVEVVYGIFTDPLHRALPVWWAFAAFLLFTCLMAGVAALKTRVVARVRGPAATASSPGRRHTP